MGVHLFLDIPFLNRWLATDILEMARGYFLTPCLLGLIHQDLDNRNSNDILEIAPERKTP